MSIEPLDYEQTLVALQAFMGTLVDVSVSGVGTQFPGVILRGPLRLAKTTDVSELVPELDGVLAGESIFFAVSDPDQPAVTAAFGIWRGGF